MSESETSIFDLVSPKDKKKALVDRFKHVDALEEQKGDKAQRDVIAWAKSIQRFLRLAWMPRKYALPKKLTLGGIDHPPFSELINPSNRRSVPSCFNRIVRDHFTFASNRTALMLTHEFDFFLQFDAFFCELGGLTSSTNFYDARSKFEEFTHQFKYYVLNTPLRHPGNRLAYQVMVKILAEEFKASCEPLSRELYEKEQGDPIPFAGPVYFDSVSGLTEEYQFQKKLMTLPGFRHVTGEDELGPAAVTRSVAAKICGVEYNTIKNWETKGPSPQAFDYPGRGNMIDLADFSNSYCDRIGVPRVADKYFKKIGLGSLIELRIQELTEIAALPQYAHLFEKKTTKT